MYRLTGEKSSLSRGVEAQPPETSQETPLHSLPFFAGLSERAIQMAAVHAVTLKFPAQRPIVLERDWGNSVYFILQGWLKVCITDPDGQIVTLNIVGKGEIFGEMAALDVGQRSTDVVAMTPVVLFSIPSADFIQLLRSEPDAGIRLARLMGVRLRRVNRFLKLRQSQAALRIADVLLFLAEVQEQNNIGEAVIPKLSHQELGSLCGLARETVTRELIALRNKKLIQYLRDSLYIPDKVALEKLCPH